MSARKSASATSDQIGDELEIRNLLALLAHLTDDGSLDDYIALFSEDAVWDGGKGLGAKKGRSEILAAGEERRAKGIAGPGSHTRHVITTSVVGVSGDHASARSAFLYYTRTHKEPKLAMLGVYQDSFVRGTSGWLLARREVRVGDSEVGVK